MDRIPAMEQVPTQTSAAHSGAPDRSRRHAAISEVAACTISAAHRRDHHHHGPQADGRPAAACHPHAVEVIHLGRSAAMVCHDCRTDTGFLPHRDAENLAFEHREDTREPVSQPVFAVERHAA
jgi:hypothetical protein